MSTWVKIPPSINGRPLVILTKKDKIEALCRRVVKQLACVHLGYQECKSQSLFTKATLVGKFMKNAFRGVREGCHSRAAGEYSDWVYKHWENLATREGISTLLNLSMCCHNGQVRKAGIWLAVFLVEEVIAPMETTKLAHQVRELKNLLNSMGEVDI